MSVKNVRPFGARDKWGYSLGDMGCNFSFQLVSTYMQLFYCQLIGVKPEHYAAIILIIIVGIIVEYGIFNTIEKNTVRKWGMVR